MKFDVLILVAEKDFVKVGFAYESIIKNIKNADGIFCVSDIDIPPHFKIPGVYHLRDRDVVDFDFTKFRGRVAGRRGWYTQQYIKLFQDVTSDNYLVIDSDAYLNKRGILFDDGKPSFLLGRDQNHEPYFRLMKTILNLDREYNHSFINEIMFFKRDIIRHMLSSINTDKKGFFDLTVDELNRMDCDAGMSEYELYGNYVTKYFRESYNYKNVRTRLNGKYGLWIEREIIDLLNSPENLDSDIITYHSWI